jgi:hypothetical protein
LLDGKPLISSLREKVEFRMVANQRVFETTFYINASDVLDGSEIAVPAIGVHRFRGDGPAIAERDK